MSTFRTGVKRIHRHRIKEYIVNTVYLEILDRYETAIIPDEGDISIFGQYKTEPEAVQAHIRLLFQIELGEDLSE